MSTASEIRKMSSQRETAWQRRRQIANMIRWGLGPQEMYDKGQKDGGKILARSLTDVLVGIKESGLGSASIMEESNAHATFRVFQSLCCQIVRGNNLEGKSCYYLAGFIAGAIEGIGGSREVESRELSCGGFGGRSCIFIARW